MTGNDNGDKDGRPRVSFCTTCMGRLAHLARALPASLAENPESDVEFVLVDYHSPDGLDAWVRRALAAELASGRLRYVRLAWPRRFAVAHAKNVAHRAAAGRILVNLDADNVATREYAAAVRTLFAAGHEVAAFDLADTRVWGGGGGRVAVDRCLFHRLGGYDEAMRGWGYEDADLVARARAAGARVALADPALLRFVKHGDVVRSALADAPDRAATYWANRARSRGRLSRGEYVANAGREWGRP
jgi:GT2 family glycosyltransferase